MSLGKGVRQKSCFLENIIQGGGKMKKSWEKPKLIVLFRGRPEERVLGLCKNSDPLLGSSQNAQLNECQDTGCPDCEIISEAS